MSTAISMSFDECREHVESMIERGAAFACVEDEIDLAELADDQKAALWLLAWSLRDPELQREDARLTLATFDGGGRP